MVSEERLEQLERFLHLAGNALQAANNRIASSESAAGTSTAAVSMVGMHVLGKPQSSLETKHHGRAGVSACCPSRQQSRQNCVH